MQVVSEFMVFNASPIFGGVESSDSESKTVVAKVNASGKRQKFAFMLAANFERGTTGTQLPMPVRCEYRVFFGDVLLEQIPVSTAIPVGQMSTTKELGLTEVHFDRVDFKNRPVCLLFEFVSDQKRIAAFEWKVTF